MVTVSRLAIARRFFVVRPALSRPTQTNCFADRRHCLESRDSHVLASARARSLAEHYSGYQLR
jgi:hypothetical protein